MTQRLRRIAAVLTALIAIGCGSDDGSKEQDSTADTPEPDAGKPTSTRDASVGRDTDSGSDESVTTAPSGESCEKLSCKEPSRCEVKSGKARCVCPTGYNDVKGDGSQCDDKDECANADDNDCDEHARCENTKGGYECTCNGVYEGDGKTCTCPKEAAGSDGSCLAPDGARCEDNLDCKNEHCVHGICCAQACSSATAECQNVEEATCEDGKTCKFPPAKDGTACDDGDACTLGSTCKAGKCELGKDPRDCDDKNPCTDDSCDAVLGCKNSNNTATCDDKNPCTENDVCSNGSCGSTSLRDCSSAGDVCNEGVCDPADGSCKKKALADGKACDDQNSCTRTDACKAGACTGDGNACGPNATACSPGTPNTCTCAANFHASAGRCVPDNDECEQNPCGANSDCFDPSNNAGDVTCSCKQGYQGDAKAGCTPINPCMDNPCGEGRGTCTPGNAGAYTCACNSGFTAIAGQCVCNLQGTFAVRQTLEAAWSNLDGIEDGRGETFSWSIERHNYDAQGNLAVEVIPCGESNLDLCGTGVPIVRIPVEAYAQYVPISVWGKAGAQTTQYQFKLEAPLPNGEWKTPLSAALQGISLTDPLGPWPATRKDVQGTSDFDGSAVNGARWIDSDGDGYFGLTTYAVGPEGVPADSPLAPFEPYGRTSTVCPRNNPNAPRSPYNYPPALDGLTTRRVKRFSSANRAISAMEGKIESCDLITGNITGPVNGAPQFDIRIGSCVRVDANGSGETACSSAMLDFLDETQTSNQITENTFIMKRVADTVTCADVRDLQY